MNRFFLINKYLAYQFSKVVMNMILIFFSLGFVMNLFEEINFFKDIDIGIYIPILMSLYIVPSLLYEMFPFIILLSGMWFFLKLKKSDEITAMKISGLSNFTIISIPSLVCIVMGIFFITSINPITSILVKKYETVKGNYERDQDYLAAITKNGIWIREKNDLINNIIRSSNLQNAKLMNVSIYEFDQNYDFIRRVEAKSADISTLNWLLEDVVTMGRDGKIISKNISSAQYVSTYNLDKIKSLYSNLDTISFWNINNEIELLKKRGYSTKQMETKLHSSFAFPFFLLAMLLLSGVFTLGLNFKENSYPYIFITISICVLVYFFNDFSAALGKTERLDVEVAVWMPIIIIFLFGSAGVIYANQK